MTALILLLLVMLLGVTLYIAARLALPLAEPEGHGNTSSGAAQAIRVADGLEIREVAISGGPSTHEVVVARSGALLARLQPLEVPPVRTEPVPSAVPAALLGQLIESFPQLRGLVGPGYAIVRVPRAVWTGRDAIARVGGVPVAQARETKGRYGARFPIVDVFRTGWRGVGPTLVVHGPGLIVTFAAMFAAAEQQRWLERTMRALQTSIDEIENRLVDSDFGELEAAERLVHLLVSDDDLDVPDQLRIELALARHRAESLYSARHRFVSRLTTSLEMTQNAQELKGERAEAWSPGSVQALGAPHRFEGEILLYLQALVARARLAACTASVMASDGNAAKALQLVESTGEQLRTDFYDLARRLKPLAAGIPGKHAGGSKEDKDDLHQAAQRLHSVVSETIAPALPPIQDDLEVLVHFENGAVVVSRTVA